MAALLLYISVFSFLIQPALSLTDFAGEDTSSVLLVLCLMILEQHIAVPCLTQNLNLARHMGKDIAEAFSLAALHLFCTFHYTVSFMERYLELAVYACYRPALEYVVGNNPHGCSFLQKFSQNLRPVIHPF